MEKTRLIEKTMWEPSMGTSHRLPNTMEGSHS
jgi:hypothetical protein